MREPAFWWRPATIWSTLLTPLGYCYGVVAARRMRRPSAHSSVPVICIGNFTLGGSGKTPTAMTIATMLRAAGETVFFLSRGYGGKLAGPHLVNVRTDWAKQVGDEAILLGRAAPTIVARDRRDGAKLAYEQGATVIVMDDGMQNSSLAKAYTIAVVDGRRGIGNERIFPAGPLRASLDGQLGYSDAVLVIGEGDGARPVIAAAQARGLPIFYGNLVPDTGSLADLKMQKILAFAGIGDPEKFFATAKAAGLSLVACRAFPDHHCFTAKEAAELIKLAERQNLALLTTEKDHARLMGEPALAELATRSRILPVNLVLKQQTQLRDLLLAKVKR